MTPEKLLSLGDDQVSHVFHPEVRPVDHDAAAREDDAREVRQLFARYASHEQAPLSVLAVLLGQSPRSAGHFGPQGTRLLDEVKAGRLRIAASLQFTGGIHPAVRHNPLSCPVERADLREWLSRHGTADDRASLAGRWAEGAGGGAS